ncbi:hypothetical protein B0H63DRAFT_489187 [Podospora didyma]|uniref:DUF7730 domain-containing protein n=1 Tax=Podospora didyma TaxID=330526 RepID=A0AAE0K2F8_9PEZI|nr:hypothetical protein B0H63DRAFT_489187 [Podospora didyma]
MDKFRRIINRTKHKPPKDDGDESGPEINTAPGAPHALDLLPSLPARRHPLTPDLPSAFSSPLTPLFTLPYELRHQIYLLVLGGTRTIHLDMRYSAATAARPHTTVGAFLHTRRWRWRVSTCHRDPSAQAAYDRCGEGGPPPTACALHDTPCTIGPDPLNMMLSCRRLYREVSAFLYGENTFHITTGVMILYTDRLLAPSLAAQIRSLVYGLSSQSVETYAREHLAIEPGWSAYRAILGAIPKAFPGLIKLELVALAAGRADVSWRYPDAPAWDRGGEHSEIHGVDGLKRALFRPMDDLVRAYRGQLRECAFVMEQVVFNSLVLNDLTEPTARTESRSDWVQFWRRLDSVACDLGENNVTAEEEEGYWVRRIVSRTEFWFNPAVPS